MTVNDNFRKTWKDTVVAYLSIYLKGLRKAMNNLRHDSEPLAPLQCSVGHYISIIH